MSKICEKCAIKYKCNEKFRHDVLTECGGFEPINKGGVMMNDKLMDLFNGISCICAEGIEFMDKTQLTDRIQKDAIAGYNLYKQANKPFRLVDPMGVIMDDFKTLQEAKIFIGHAFDLNIEVLCINGEWVKIT